MKKKIIILAGNFLQFQSYARVNQEIKHKLVYASGTQALAGIEAEKVEVIGTFWDKENAGKLYDFAMTRVRKLSKPRQQKKQSIQNWEKRFDLEFGFTFFSKGAIAHLKSFIRKELKAQKEEFEKELNHTADFQHRLGRLKAKEELLKSYISQESDIKEKWRKYRGRKTFFEFFLTKFKNL